MGGGLGNNAVITAKIFTSMFQTGFKLVTPTDNIILTEGTFNYPLVNKV